MSKRKKKRTFSLQKVQREDGFSPLDQSARIFPDLDTAPLDTAPLESEPLVLRVHLQTSAKNILVQWKVYEPNGRALMPSQDSVITRRITKHETLLYVGFIED